MESMFFVAAWFVVAVLLVIAELLSGTFALLFAAFGAFSASAIAATGVAGGKAQFAVFAIAAIAGLVVAMRRSALAHTVQDMPPASIGHAVTVINPPDASGMVRIEWRGTEWDALLRPPTGQAEKGDLLKITGEENGQLIVGHIQ